MVLFLFIGHYSNITLFYHTHTIGGITYSHSHFKGFDSSENDNQQTHSSNELQLIHELNQITWSSEINFAALATPVFHIISEFSCPELQQNSLFAPVYADLRAPPSFIA